MKKPFSARLLLLFMFIALPSSAWAMGHKKEYPELKTVSQVDVQKYLGTWYEIASFPQSFQKNCTATQATYNLRDNGDLDVLNQCRKGNPQGKLSEAHGRAWIVEPQTNAKLKVQFFWPFKGDYWIIDLGTDYEYTVVGAPNRDYLWILAREKTLDPTTYEAILSRISEQGFDVRRLQKTIH